MSSRQVSVRSWIALSKRGQEIPISPTWRDRSARIWTPDKQKKFRGGSHANVHLLKTLTYLMKTNVESNGALGKAENNARECYRAANRERVAAQVARYYRANRDRIRAWNRNYKIEHREELSEKRRVYYLANRD